MLVGKKIQFILYLAFFIPAINYAEENGDKFEHFYLQAGTYKHYQSNDDYAGPDIFIALEAIKPDCRLYGLALFDNSFGQFSQYLYTGKVWNYHGGLEGFHTKLTVGLLHGYKGEFQDKIPFNHYGIAPAIVPGAGYKNGRFGADVFMLGLSGLLFTVGMDL
ncbi:hypothetical protein OMP95_11805 [Methylophaga sp. OBS4]|nr:hypothetical protein [Methylophaga sp. OBS4]